MFKGKRFLAIIPARCGSKGLKDKNIKDLNGKPMIAYSIESAIKSGFFDDIVVSTDSKRYADIAIKNGAEVPFLRPGYLATDEATTINVICYTLNELEKRDKLYDYFMILQPTSPLRTADNIIESVDLMFEKKAISVVSVCEAEHSPLYMNTLDKTLSLTGFLIKGIKSRRQEMQKYYRLNGAIYLCEVNYFLKHQDFYGDNSYAYIMDRLSSVDIDDEIDFTIASSILENKNLVYKK